MPKILRCPDHLLAKDLTGKIAIVTGANQNVGLETARQLVKQNCTVVMACRRKAAGESAAAEIGGIFMQLDLSSLSSVRKFVGDFQQQHSRLDFLVNNAGTACKQGQTADGFELMMGTNHLGHFLLTVMLQPLLESSGPGSRVIAVSSVAAADMGQGMATIDFDDLMMTSRKFNMLQAYGASKLANVLMIDEAARRFAGSGVIYASVHPGWVDSSLGSEAFGVNRKGERGCCSLVNCLVCCFTSCSCARCNGTFLGPVDGAQTSLYCCLEDADRMENGAFYSQNGIYKDKQSKKGGWPMPLPNPNRTPESATKLWGVSAKLVGWDD